MQRMTTNDRLKHLVDWPEDAIPEEVGYMAAEILRDRAFIRTKLASFSNLKEGEEAMPLDSMVK